MQLQNSQVRRYWDTARHLKLSQMWRYVRRPRPRLAGIDVGPRTRAGQWTASVQRTSPWIGGKRWRHLHQEREIKTWNDRGPEKLWLYHLHYLDRPCAETVAWWMDENPPGRGIGWEPYPLSRRIANWVVWLVDESLDPEFRRRAEASLAMQAQWLSQSFEWHLLGNHLLANAQALVMAGAYFEGPAAHAWLRHGLGVLRRELAEQVLEDGSHFELSPMYHALILEDLLDLVNLSAVYPRVLKSEFTEWRAIAGRMLGWLEQLTHPDGEISYFNDSVQGTVASLGELGAYAVRLGVKHARSALGSSGYVRLEKGGTIVLFDAGPVGPDYQPGHGHCDLLSLEISHRGTRTISNSGVSTYEPGPRRLAERGTAAHNTLRVDGAEQSEIWQSFRVARRARVIDRQTDGQSWVTAGHDGYRRLRGGVTHWRRVDVGDGHVTVRDRLEGTGVHQAEVFWHLGASANVEIEFDGGLERRTETGSWCEGFGLRRERPTVVGEWRGRLPVNLVTHIRFD